MSKSFASAAAIAACLAGVSMPAAAQFQGYYAVGNWMLVRLNNDHGVIDLTGEPGSITMTSSTDPAVLNPINDGYASGLEFKIAAQATGTFSFNWSYVTTDGSGPAYDPAFYLQSGQHVLSDDLGAANQNATVSVHVSAGEIIGFRIDSQDNFGGTATLTISNFSAPITAVPEPASATMIAAGLLGLGGVVGLRRRPIR